MRTSLIALLAAACTGSSSGSAPSVTALDSRTHGPRFPIAQGAHAVDCNECHGPFETFRQFTCLGCHGQSQTDPRHAAVTGYSWDSARCYACHPEGEALGVDHTGIFPIEAGSDHGSVRCAECHVDPGNRQVLGCNHCHAHEGPALGSAHASVGGYADDAALCVRCHADAQVDRVAAHLPFGITASFDHFRTSCLDCHPARRADKPFGADFERESVNCLSCHQRTDMDDKHQAMPTYRYQSLTCLSGGCHANGTKPED